jgi:hypothetical protein
MKFDSEFLLPFSNIKIKYTELYSACFFFFFFFHFACCFLWVCILVAHTEGGQ